MHTYVISTVVLRHVDINPFMPLCENSYLKLLIKIPTLETSEPGKQIHIFSSLGRSAFGLTHDLTVAVFPTLALTALTQRATSR
jgi:hypothetical protein